MIYLKVGSSPAAAGAAVRNATFRNTVPARAPFGTFQGNGQLRVGSYS